MTTEFHCNSSTYGGGNVAYSRAVGLNDTLHYVISTVGVPTVLVFHTALDNDPRIDCPRLLSGNVSVVENSITFTKPPFYTYALMFTKVRGKFNFSPSSPCVVSIGSLAKIFSP